MWHVKLLKVRIEHDSGNFSPSKQCVSYHRAGTSLLEMVTGPDFNSARDVKKFLSKLKLIFKGISTFKKTVPMRFDLNFTIAIPLDSMRPRIEFKNLTYLTSIDRLIDGMVATFPKHGCAKAKTCCLDSKS